MFLIFMDTKWIKDNKQKGLPRDVNNDFVCKYGKNPLFSAKYNGALKKIIMS